MGNLATAKRRNLKSDVAAWLRGLGYQVADVERSIVHGFPRGGRHSEDCFGFGDLLVHDAGQGLGLTALCQVTSADHAADHRAKMQRLAGCLDWIANSRRSAILITGSRSRPGPRAKAAERFHSSELILDRNARPIWIEIEWRAVNR